ncbi:hypothetical protein L4C34_14010 [Vibrio profundum]|uniref:hypothetical protein n=1 Tax=Vibrio profundum TaxID=2910247 RepID=UPI003D0E64FB
MTQRNIHGVFTMTFDNRVLDSKVVGETNKELSLEWFEELQRLLFSSSEGDTLPWALLHDCSQWIGSSMDAWEANNTITDWMIERNCVFSAIVVPGQLQHFVVEKEIKNQEITHFFTNREKAYQACLDKINEVNKRQNQ